MKTIATISVAEPFTLARRVVAIVASKTVAPTVLRKLLFGWSVELYFVQPGADRRIAFFPLDVAERERKLALGLAGEEMV